MATAAMSSKWLPSPVSALTCTPRPAPSPDFVKKCTREDYQLVKKCAITKYGLCMGVTMLQLACRRAIVGCDTSLSGECLEFHRLRPRGTRSLDELTGYGRARPRADMFWSYREVLNAHN